MSLVFERYRGMGNNERMLALALADHAHDDGTHIWPSVKSLAQKADMHERSVQRLLRVMVLRGWLECVRHASGRPGDTTEYRISAAWIAGGALREIGGATGDTLPPVEASSPGLESVDNVIHTGGMACETGDKNSETGDRAVSPESSEPSGTNTPLTPRCRGGHVDNPSKSEQPNSRTAVTSKRVRKPWRWTDKRCDVEAQGARLGLGAWDEQAYNRGQGEPWQAYRARVIRAAENEEA